METTEINGAEECNCGCKDGVCACENCTNEQCECGTCKMKAEKPEVAADAPVA